MRKSKTAFRAMREECGLTQQDIADETGANKVTVKRWERSDVKYYEPPDEVWEWLLTVRETMRADAESMAERLMRMAASIQWDKSLTISYYRTQEELDAVQLPAGLDRPVGFVNATARRVADILEGNGWEVEYIPGSARFEKREDAAPDSKVGEVFPHYEDSLDI